jgi:hypothetical protein
MKATTNATMKMRFWIEMLAIVTAIAFALALLIATLGAAATAVAEKEPVKPAQSAAVQPQIYEGIITDTRCGAKHSATAGMSARDCTQACVRSGEHFALVDGDSSYTLEGDPTALKRVAGQRVKIAGTRSGNMISVASIAAATS